MEWFWWIPISIAIAVAGTFVLLVLGWIGMLVYSLVRGWIDDYKEVYGKEEDDLPITDKQARRVIWRNYYRKHPEQAER